MNASPVPYFEPLDGLLVPNAEARSPWSDDMLHGRLLAGLAARAAEHDAGGSADAPAGSMRLARLTLDMFRSPPMAPLSVETAVARAGQRVRALDVSIAAAGVEVARARALLLREAVHPATAGVWQAPAWEAPPPESLPQFEGAATTGWDIRPFNPGGFWSAERMRAWSRDGAQLVAGEVLSPAVRAAMSSDLPNPMANSGPEGLAFINPDLTLYLGRLPVSAWIGLEVVSHVGADGIAVGSCTMYDTAGAIGWSTVSAVVYTATLAG